MESPKIGRPKATYGESYLNSCLARPGEWLVFSFDAKDFARKVARWVRREGVRAHLLDLGDEVLVAMKVEHEDDTSDAHAET